MEPTNLTIEEYAIIDEALTLLAKDKYSSPTNLADFLTWVQKIKATHDKVKSQQAALHPLDF